MKKKTYTYTIDNFIGCKYGVARTHFPCESMRGSISKQPAQNLETQFLILISEWI